MAKARWSGCSDGCLMTLITVQQAERSFWSKQQLSIFQVHTIHMQPPRRKIISWGELQSCRHFLFFFYLFKEFAFQPLSCLWNEKPAAIPDDLQGWTLCTAREEHDDGQQPDLLLVLQEAKSYSSAAQSQALFPSSSSSSTAATEENCTWRTAVSVSCQIHFTFCHGLFLRISVQLSCHFSGWWTEIYLPDLELRNN